MSEPVQRNEFVYLIKHPEGLLKVGRSRKPSLRLKQHQRFSAAPLEGLCIFPCKDSKTTEADALDKLSNYRIYGEWFKVDEDVAKGAISLLTGSDPLPFPPSNSRATKRVGANRQRPDSLRKLYDDAHKALEHRHGRKLSMTEHFELLGGTDIDIWIGLLPASRRPVAAPQERAMQRVFQETATSRRSRGID